MEYCKIKKMLRTQSGFTLVELIIVIVILSITVLPLSGLLRRNLTTAVQAEQITKASFFAQQKIEQILKDYSVTGNANIVTSSYYESYHGMACNVSAIDDSLNGVRYSDVTVTVSGSDIPDIELNVWLVY